jgi:hypothetical protein
MGMAKAATKATNEKISLIQLSELEHRLGKAQLILSAKEIQPNGYRKIGKSMIETRQPADLVRQPILVDLVIKTSYFAFTMQQLKPNFSINFRMPCNFYSN